MYGWRKIIIDEIRRRQAEGINVGAAVEVVDLMRQQGQLSLVSVVPTAQQAEVEQ
jgi:hypothetical protein